MQTFFLLTETNIAESTKQIKLTEMDGLRARTSRAEMTTGQKRCTKIIIIYDGMSEAALRLNETISDGMFKINMQYFCGSHEILCWVVLWTADSTSSKQ